MRSTLKSAALMLCAALGMAACRGTNPGDPWGPRSRGGQATTQSNASAHDAGATANRPVAPAGAELAQHPEIAMPNEHGPGPRAGVQLAPDRRPAPGEPAGMGGGPSVYGRAGGKFERAYGGADHH